MSMPNFPNFPEVPVLDVNVAIAYIILSIALEELGLAHVINAEGEKIQAVALNPNSTPSDLIAINNSVEKTLKTVIKSQIVTEFKLQEALEGLQP